MIGEWGRSVAGFGILDASGEREGKDRPYVRGADCSWLAGVALYLIVDLLGKRLSYEQ